MEKLMRNLLLTCATAVTAIAAASHDLGYTGTAGRRRPGCERQTGPVRLWSVRLVPAIRLLSTLRVLPPLRLRLLSRYAYGYYRPYAYGAYAYGGYGPRVWVGWGPRRWW